MRIALAQINPTLGSFQENAKKIIEYTKRAKEKNCDMVIFPEAALFGYHPFDLLERRAIVDQQLKYVKIIQREVPAGITLVFGLITKNSNKKGKPYFNSAMVFTKGQKPQLFHKQLLPTGDVFDEARFIENGSLSKNFFKLKGKTVFLTICEDIWAWPDKNGKSFYKENPLSQVKGKVDLVINLSASPFYSFKSKVRHNLAKNIVKKFKAPFIYVNMVGAQDEIIFDGGSFAFDRKSKLVSESMFFEEDLNIFDVDENQGGRRKQKLDNVEQIKQALVLGIRDFCAKAGLKQVHLGISGGIDSAVVACLACDALGPSKVTGLALPGPFNAPASLALSVQLAKNLGLNFIQLPITDLYDQSKNTVDTVFKIQEFSVVHENLQARLRGLLLMAYANHKNSLLLATGNKSEFATGYSTLYGDMCGGLVPIGDLTKDQVYAIAKHYNQSMEIIPAEIIARPPSAELKPNQKDQDTLPAYDLLDKSVTHIVENGGAVKGETDRWLITKLINSEFKRWQAPPILKVTKRSFGRGRRFPIAHQAKEI